MQLGISRFILPVIHDLRKLGLFCCNLLHLRVFKDSLSSILKKVFFCLKKPQLATGFKPEISYYQVLLLNYSAIAATH